MKTFHALLSAFVLFAFVHVSTAQDCTSCANDFRSNRQPAGTSANSPTLVNTNTSSWFNSIRPATNGIARFSNPGFYKWEASGNNPVSIGGLILEQGVTLILDRQNSNQVEAFDIVGGCIIVKNNAKLDLRYFTELKSVTICVEAGGKIIFDSRRGDGTRNDFKFEDVVINLQGPTATLEFGQADLILAEDGLAINGWTGEDICSNVTPPTGGVSGNISWSNETINICELLNGRVLPVEWLYTNADFHDKERSVSIEWATAKEWENSHFEIERSIDGINDFQQVGEVQGMGWKDSITEYAFLDKDLPLTGGNMLYRLKQVDFNGKSSYSKVVSVKVSTIQSTKGVWRAYPNPTNGQQLKINLLDRSQYDEESITFRIINPTTVSNVVSVKSENEMNDTIGQMIGGIPKGIFVVEISWGQKVEHIKVLKK